MTLKRAFGAVAVTAVTAHALHADELVFEAVLGPFRAPMVVVAEGRLGGQLPELPTGADQILVVEGRDRAGAVLYQGHAVVNVEVGQMASAMVRLAPLGLDATLPGVNLTTATPTFAAGDNLELLLEPDLVVRGAAPALASLFVDWGDGQRERVPLSVTAAADATEPVRVAHRFADVGAHVVTAVVTTTDGHVGQASLVVDVHPANPGDPDRVGALVRVELWDVPDDAREVKLADGLVLLREGAATWSGWRRARKGTVLDLMARASLAGTPNEVAGASALRCPVAERVTSCEGAFGPRDERLGDGGRLVLSRTGVWLSGIGATDTVSVRAFDAAGAPIPTEALAIEWLSTDTRRVRVQSAPGDAQVA